MTITAPSNQHTYVKTNNFSFRTEKDIQQYKKAKFITSYGIILFTIQNNIIYCKDPMERD